MTEKQSKLEREFWVLWKLLAPGWPKPQTEHRFHPSRRWRFDYAWPGYWVAVELQGGIYKRKQADGTSQPGRHAQPYGMNNDYEKHNEATVCGWVVLYFSADHLRIKPDWCVDVVKQTLDARSALNDA